MSISQRMPDEVQTARLCLRAWRSSDAAALRAALESNFDRIAPWIPAHVATPAPIPEMEARLIRSAAAFADNREWRFGIFPLGDDLGHHRVLGEMSLFPRDAKGRVPLAQADRVELGYWISADATGRGLVTEGARALLDVAATIAAFSQAEIRCDARNAPSGAVAQRLGFVLQPASPLDDNNLQVWTRALRE
jgi:RimJ/RimL family protein N-acetyltransferase